MAYGGLIPLLSTVQLHKKWHCKDLKMVCIQANIMLQMQMKIISPTSSQLHTAQPRRSMHLQLIQPVSNLLVWMWRLYLRWMVNRLLILPVIKPEDVRHYEIGAKQILRISFLILFTTIQISKLLCQCTVARVVCKPWLHCQCRSRWM